MKIHSLFLALSVASGAMGTTLVAHAAETPAYPNKPIILLVGFPPGGQTDMMARRYAKALEDELKQTIVVENRPGASGQIASAAVARSAPDGYTILVASTHHVISPAIYAKLPYDTEKAFTPIAQLVLTPNVLLVPPSSPLSNLQNYIKHAKKLPNGLDFGSTSVGGSTHMSGEMLTIMTGAPLLHVPYKGSAPMMTDLLGGQISSAFNDLQGSIPFLNSGKLKAIGVTSATRSPTIPDVPTFAEQGVPGYDISTFIGVYGPAGLPTPIVDLLNKIAVRSTNEPESVQFLKDSGGTPSKMNPSQFANFIKEEIAKWKHVAKQRNIVVE